MLPITGAGAGAVKRPLWPRWSVVHHVSTGQSLSVGYPQIPVSLTQPFSNVKLFDSIGVYDVTNPNAATLSFVPLVTPQRPNPITANNPYPANIPGPSSIAGESLETPMANQITRLALAAGLAGYVIHASCVGEGGQPLSVIQAGTQSFNAALYEARVRVKDAKAHGYVAGCAGVTLTHGETDADNLNAGYLAGLVALWQAFDVALRGIYGQTRTVPMVQSQMNSNPPAGGGENIVAMQQVLSAQQNRGKIVLAGPKYQYPYADGQHLVSYTALAEKYAQVWSILDGDQIWEPLWPIAAVRSGTSLVLTFHVPVAPLVFDGVASPPHQSGGLTDWANGKGFEFKDNAQAITGATNASPIVLTIPGGTANYINGQKIFVDGVHGNTNANGPQTITVVDATHISLNGTTGNGVWTVGGTAKTIIGVTAATISGNTVTLTLARAPVVGTGLVAYAHTSDLAYGGGVNYTGGFPSGRCGLLRDSDPYTGPSGFANRNWCVEFEMAVA